MKCIKRKCKFCLENDFFSSAYVCDLSCKTFLKVEAVNCDIDREIESRETRLKELKDYALIIRSDQYED